MTLCILGDALGIYPENNPQHVLSILNSLGFSGKEEIDIPPWAHTANSGKYSHVSFQLKI